MIEHEVIVVGGGPAGAAAAWALTRRGFDCRVLDRATFPREKLCAGWITPEVVTDLEFDPTEYPHRFHTFQALRIAVKGLPLTLRSTQHSIRRYEFDAWMLQRTGAPFDVHEVRRIQREGETYVLDARYRCRYLIGAGGTRCPVYRTLFRERQPRDRGLQAVTLELEFPFDWRDPNCRLWFLDQGLPGYSWYVPKADGFVNVGVGAMASKLKTRGEDIQRHWALLVRRLLSKGLLEAPPGDPGGYSYFVRGPADTMRRHNAFVVGDALGLATRDMCEGIGPAVRSGLLAANAIMDNVPPTLGAVGEFTIGNKFAHNALASALSA